MNSDLFNRLLLEEGMQCLFQVAIPEGINMSTPH